MAVPGVGSRRVLARFLAHRLAMCSLVVLAGVFTLAFIGARLWRYGYRDITDDLSSAPSWTHPMGTDAIGHDLFAQVLRGTQKSLQVALIVAVLSTAAGTLAGGVAGFYRGGVDALIMRFTDVVLSVPGIAVLAVLAASVRGSAGNWLAVALVLSSLSWMGIARVVRSLILSLREQPFVEAARAVGARDRRILFRHLLPHAVGPIIVKASLTVGTAVLAETALSFLGLGISPPDTSLGRLVDAGQHSASTRPWLFYFPGLVILVVVLCVNFVGDGLRDALDPSSHRRG
jgi:ABC-type dipeptide/oligopeptide/nickel transport system permease subunit